MTFGFTVHILCFVSALVLTLVLTPVVREMNRRLGMVDKPDPRRINRVPIPRGGGIALVLGVLLAYVLTCVFMDWTPGGRLAGGRFWRLVTLGLLTAAVGLADDRFSLKPKIKLAFQVLVGFLVWAWADLGFRDLWPDLPAVIDCLLTTFWMVGAMNAFNLIDGLDGLAAGLALIATIGMAGALAFTGNFSGTPFYFAFAGGLLGFLRYNYNPASVFLGDCGSMSIGYTLAVLPLCAHAPNSFLVSVGVPLLAMGVPIFDTSLAIVRRSIRHLISRGKKAPSGQVMTADVDHLHHRILRASGLNQRKAAWSLYLLALASVSVGLVGMLLKSRAAGLWLVAVAGAGIVIFKDMARVEFFDAGRLLNSVAHDRSSVARRRWARISVPFYLTCDLVMLVAVAFVVQIALTLKVTREFVTIAMPVRVVMVFAALIFMRTYRTVWARAFVSNYVRLIMACLGGAIVSSVVLYYTGHGGPRHILAFTLAYATTTSLAVAMIRMARGVIRDFFYALDCSRLVGRKDVSRVLVYGCGLRYRAFRRELVRRTAENNRIIVGILDDDILMRNHYVGGIKVFGPLACAPEAVNATNADTVIIACDVKPSWLTVVRETLRPTGVKIVRFSYGEELL